MKRLSFLTALLGIGVAKAQTICDKIAPSGNLICGGKEMRIPPLNTVATIGRSADHPRIKPQPGERMRRITAWYGKPLNGECPVCGTMAEPHGPTTVTTWKNIADFGGRSIPVEETIRSPRFVACTHCRVLFQQEAEGDGSH